MSSYPHPETNRDQALLRKMLDRAQTLDKQVLAGQISETEYIVQSIEEMFRFFDQVLGPEESMELEESHE